MLAGTVELLILSAQGAAQPRFQEAAIRERKTVEVLGIPTPGPSPASPGPPAHLLRGFREPDVDRDVHGLAQRLPWTGS